MPAATGPVDAEGGAVPGERPCRDERVRIETLWREGRGTRPPTAPAGAPPPCGQRSGATNPAATAPRARRLALQGPGRGRPPARIEARPRGDDPDRPRAWGCHEAVYRALHVQGQGARAPRSPIGPRPGRARRRPCSRAVTAARSARPWARGCVSAAGPSRPPAGHGGGYQGAGCSFPWWGEGPRFPARPGGAARAAVTRRRVPGTGRSRRSRAPTGPRRPGR